MLNKRIGIAQVLGVNIDAISLIDLMMTIERMIRHREHAIVANVNAHAINLACEQPWFRDFLNNQSSLVFCDGFGVKWGGQLLGYHIPERFTYADWMWQVAEFAESRGFSFFFLGARPTVAEKAAERLLARFTNLSIVGTHHGYFDKTHDSPENQSVVNAINRVKPNLLVLGFGMPFQERWLMENWDELDADVALTGGAVFDYISGELRRGPRWMTDHGLEWLARLIIEPNRLWKRYVLGNPLFVWRVLMQKLKIKKYAPPH